MKRIHFTENQIYHIYNRGVEKRKIFLDDKDHFRFIHNLFEFNDKDASPNNSYFFNKQSMEVESRQIKKENKPRKLLVEILAFTLMPNHFHLLVRQKRENGITKFMRKLGTGYANYFNTKYKRVGGLFQGKFKAVLVEQDAHFIHLPYYIHTNPLDLNYNNLNAIDFLKKYRWSSFPDYIGEKNFPSITSREFLLKFFGGEKEYKKEMKRWINERDKYSKEINNLTLE